MVRHTLIHCRAGQGDNSPPPFGLHEGKHGLGQVIEGIHIDRKAPTPAIKWKLFKRTHGLIGGRMDQDGRFADGIRRILRSEEHTAELQSLMRSSYAGFRLKKKT